MRCPVRRCTGQWVILERFWVVWCTLAGIFTNLEMLPDLFSEHSTSEFLSISSSRVPKVKAKHQTSSYISSAGAGSR